MLSKIFSNLFGVNAEETKGTEERRSFFEQIMDVISLLGGDMNYAD